MASGGPQLSMVYSAWGTQTLDHSKWGRGWRRGRCGRSRAGRWCSCWHGCGSFKPERFVVRAAAATRGLLRSAGGTVHPYCGRLFSAYRTRDTARYSAIQSDIVPIHRDTQRNTAIHRDASRYPAIHCTIPYFTCYTEIRAIQHNTTCDTVHPPASPLGVNMSTWCLRGVSRCLTGVSQACCTRSSLRILHFFCASRVKALNGP